MRNTAKDLAAMDHLHALRGAAAEADRLIGDESAEVPARAAESRTQSATPMSGAIASVERRIAALDRLLVNLETQRRAARARWELASADYYSSAQEKVMAHKRELQQLIDTAQKL